MFPTKPLSVPTIRLFPLWKPLVQCGHTERNARGCCCSRLKAEGTSFETMARDARQKAGQDFGSKNPGRREKQNLNDLGLFHRRDPEDAEK